MSSTGLYTQILEYQLNWSEENVNDCSLSLIGRKLVGLAKEFKKYRFLPNYEKDNFE